MFNKLLNKKGFTLVEVTVVMTLSSIIFVMVAGTFYQFGKGIAVTKARTMATSIAQEKIEVLKNMNYHRVLVTQEEDLPENGGEGYDTRTFDPYEKETLVVGDIKFTRQLLIYKARESVTTGDITLITTPDTTSDTGLKVILVTVKWVEHSYDKELQVANAIQDPNRVPLDGQIYGFITSTGTIFWGGSGNPPADRARLANARVVVLDNPIWEAYTDTAGYYELNTATGTWKLWISKHGYYDNYSASLDVQTGSPVEHNVQLQYKLTGFVTGYCFLNPDLIITHGSNGEYGHPQHIYTHQATQLALNNHSSGVSLMSWSAWFEPAERERVLNRDDPANIVRDVTQWLDTKIEAALCHKTQHAMFLRNTGAPSIADMVLRTESFHIWKGPLPDGL